VSGIDQHRKHRGYKPWVLWTAPHTRVRVQYTAKDQHDSRHGQADRAANLQRQESVRSDALLVRSDREADRCENDSDDEKDEGQHEQAALGGLQGSPVARWHRLQWREPDPALAVNGRHRRRIGVDDDGRACKFGLMLLSTATALFDGHSLQRRRYLTELEFDELIITDWWATRMNDSLQRGTWGQSARCCTSCYRLHSDFLCTSLSVYSRHLAKAKTLLYFVVGHHDMLGCCGFVEGIGSYGLEPHNFLWICCRLSIFGSGFVVQLVTEQTSTKSEQVELGPPWSVYFCDDGNVYDKLLEEE